MSRKAERLAVVPADESELLTPTQVAARLKISRMTVVRLVQSGELPAVNVGTRLKRFWRVDVADVERYKRRNRV